MPKVISRGTTVASGTETQFTDEKIFVYYCVCGTLCLTIGTPLEKLPRRKTDNAHILQSGKQEFRFKTQPLDPITIKRDKGFEKQYRSGCQECGLPVCYTPKPKDSPLTYVLPGALRLQQYGSASDPLPLETIKELPGVEYDEYVAEQRKEKLLREAEEEGDEAEHGPRRLSDLPRHEQERQIREKLKALERGDDTPLSASSTTTSSLSSSSARPVAVTSPSSSSPTRERSRSREVERKRGRETDGDSTAASGGQPEPKRPDDPNGDNNAPEPDEKRRRRSTSRERG